MGHVSCLQAVLNGALQPWPLILNHGLREEGSQALEVGQHVVALYFRGSDADSYPHDVYGPGQVMKRGANRSFKVLFWDGAQQVLSRQDCFVISPHCYKQCLSTLKL
jgi:hypothetical protein